MLQANLIPSLFQIDDNPHEGLFIQSDSLQSFDQAGSNSIIKQQSNFASTTLSDTNKAPPVGPSGGDQVTNGLSAANLGNGNLSVGLQSPDYVSDQDLLIQ